MASPNGGDSKQEQQQTFLERKKSVFERTREADEELQKIRQEEWELRKRQQEKNEIEYLRQTLERLKIENTQLKSMQAKERKSLDNDMTAHTSAHEGKEKNLEEKLSSMKKKIAVCEREHGRAGDVNEMKKELETLRQQNVEQSTSVRKLKDAMRRITSYSKTQRKEKVQALRRVASLEDEIAALRLISVETRQRQLNEV